MFEKCNFYVKEFRNKIYNFMWLYICLFLLVYNVFRCIIVLVLIFLGIKKRDLLDGFIGK